MKQKFKSLLLSTIGGLTAVMYQVVYADPTAPKGTATDIDVVDNLGATVKALLAGNGGLVIDGLILSAAAYGTAVTKSPAPIVCGIISCGIFHLALKVLLA